MLESIVDGINTGKLDALMTCTSQRPHFAPQPWSLAHGVLGVRESLAAFIAIKGLDLKVTRVLEAGGRLSWPGSGHSRERARWLAVRLTGHNADVLRRQADGPWRFVIDNPWGTDSILGTSARGVDLAWVLDEFESPFLLAVTVNGGAGAL
jgi:hypothetical protein